MTKTDSQVERCTCDVLVVGGGPAGSTVAPLLADKGHRVVLLEKAHHPRFHIGESLLPANMPLLEQLGVAKAVRAIGMLKPGAEFVSQVHGRSETYAFADAWDRSMPTALQVPRAAFDEVLIRNAQARGVAVHEGTHATAVDLSHPDHVRVTAVDDAGQTTEWQARFLVDASGRDTLVANHLRIKTRNERHNSTAVYTHYRGAQRHTGNTEGNISIFWFDHGWFWFIPLPQGVTSVGMVTWPYHLKTRGARSLAQFLEDNIATCPALAQRLAQAERVHPVEATGNFSYQAQQTHGPRHLLLGDAYAFVDPVFSSGVWLAMHSGLVGADTVDTCLREPHKAPAALRRFDRVMRHGPRQFSWFIYRVTNPIMRDFFMGPRNLLRVKEALLSVLAGDIFGQTPIWRSLWAFKALYYSANLLQPRRAWRAWRQRRHNIRRVDGTEPHHA